MPSRAPYRSLAPLEARLPFHVLDYEQANEAFLRWRASGRGDHREVVEVWVYCYTWRFFLTRFTGHAGPHPVEFDQLVGDTFNRLLRRLDTVAQPDRFSVWVRSTCRNAFVSYLQHRHPHVAFEEETGPGTPPVEVAGHDRQAIRTAIERAIERLPQGLREVASLRLLEGQSYSEISAATGRPHASLRSYMYKTFTRFRVDPELRALLEELQM